MRTILILATTFIAGTSAFGVLPTIAPISSRRSSSTTSTITTTTSLHEFLTVEERASKIERWSEIRAMTQEEANAHLSSEELETYNKYYAEVREGVLKMQELAKLMMQDVDKAKGIAPKTNGQRKRDKWARVQARAAANAAAAAKL